MSRHTAEDTKSHILTIVDSVQQNLADVDTPMSVDSRKGGNPLRDMYSSIARAVSQRHDSKTKLTNRADDLQVEGVIPRSPSPVRLEDRDIDTLSLEEARQLLAQQREQKQSQLMVKRERDEKDVASADDEEIEITTQRPTKRNRRCPDPAAEVVDLTELLD